jgi:type IV pilus assembly protein PilW
MAVAHRQRGISLIELMIAMMLGLLVVAAAGAIFLSNKRVYGTTETLGRVQENSRVAFELMAREVREAGGTPCGRNIPIANVLKNQTDYSYSWGDGLLGLETGVAGPAGTVDFGTGAGQRVKEKGDAIILKGAVAGAVSVSKHNPASATIFLSNNSHGFKDNDVLLICDYSQASIFQVTGPTNPKDHVVHNTGTGTIGNLCKALSFPVDPTCSSKPKDGKQYGDNSLVAKLGTTTWYVGHNGRGSTSLYRKILQDTPEEVTEGVEDMQIQYLVPGASTYSDAFPATDSTSWLNVNSVRIVLTMRAVEGAERGAYIQGTDGKALTRTMSQTVTLRNRMP